MNENSFFPLEDVFYSLQESFYRMAFEELHDYIIGIDSYKEIADWEEELQQTKDEDYKAEAKRNIESIKTDIKEISEHYADSDEIREFITKNIEECEEKINDIIVLLTNTNIYHYLAKVKTQLKNYLNSNFQLIFFERCLPEEIDNKFAVELAWIFYGHFQSMLLKYRDLLDKLQHEYITCRITAENEADILRRVFYDSKTIFNISTDLSLSNIRKGKDQKLEISNNAIGYLFHYLKRNNVILNYNTASLAKIVSPLTGISEQKLRTKFLDEQNLYKEGKARENNRKDLAELQVLLKSIQAQIESDF